jgi:hypothetical protein
MNMSPKIIADRLERKRRSEHSMRDGGLANLNQESIKETSPKKSNYLAQDSKGRFSRKPSIFSRAPSTNLSGMKRSYSIKVHERRDSVYSNVSNPSIFEKPPLEDDPDENIFNNQSSRNKDKKKTPGFSQTKHNFLSSERDLKKADMISLQVQDPGLICPDENWANSQFYEGDRQSLGNMPVIPEIPVDHTDNEMSRLETINSSMNSPKKQPWYQESPESPSQNFGILGSQFEESGKNVFMNTTFGGINRGPKK